VCTVLRNIRFEYSPTLSSPVNTPLTVIKNGARNYYSFFVYSCVFANRINLIDVDHSKTLLAPPTSKLMKIMANTRFRWLCNDMRCYFSDVKNSSSIWLAGFGCHVWRHPAAGRCENAAIIAWVVCTLLSLCCSQIGSHAESVLLQLFHWPRVTLPSASCVVVDSVREFAELRLAVRWPVMRVHEY